jgi:translation initiation factor 2 subunit 2
MDINEYEILLDKAYAELPKVLYKKERFVVPNVTGKLIKSRTVITNFTDIAKHIERDREHFAKFMLKDLGVRGEVGSRGDLILHSRFQPEGLNKAVGKYFDQFVKCSHCQSPDTVFINDVITLKCNACGHEGSIPKL